MQEKGEKALFVEQLKAMLDWYTFQAEDEEYDEANVEKILNLLDSFEPIGEGELPQRDAAWERFRRMAGEELPERAVRKTGSSAADSAETVGEDSYVRAAQVPHTPVPHKPLARVGRFVARYKYIAAAVLVLFVLAVGGTAQAIATQGSGFFFWLKRDETGTEMMVSPEGLDIVTGKKEYTYSDIEDAPEWAQEWAQTADRVEMPEGYEFQYFEVSEFEYYQGVVGYYSDHVTDAIILLGLWMYYGKLSYNKEEFIGYNYVQSYDAGDIQMDIFNRTEGSEDIFYVISFYKGNCQYLVKGQNDLEELKQLAEQYLYSVQGNL